MALYNRGHRLQSVKNNKSAKIHTGFDTKVPFTKAKSLTAYTPIVRLVDIVTFS